MLWCGGGYHGYLSQAGVDGAHQHPEGLAGAAPHGAEDLAQEGDEAQPALHVRLLHLVPVGEVPLWAAGGAGETELAPASLNSHSSTRSDLLRSEIGGATLPVQLVVFAC